VGTPVLELFALTNPPHQWAPWRVPYRQLYRDVPCRICYSRMCPFQHECLRLVSPHDVVDAAAQMLGAGGPHDEQKYEPIDVAGRPQSAIRIEPRKPIAPPNMAAGWYPVDDPVREMGQ
jgi:hypothetical protein